MNPPVQDLGTLVVVILKARNLPNKRHIGKQDPFCSIVFNGEKRRTKAIRRGGQHPEWDEEVRFTLYEEPGEESTRYVDGDASPPPPPPKSTKGPPNIQGGLIMAVACYAEDPREPDLIGEAKVDLTEVLTKGETDEWFTLMHKDKYCGEVYLELTFWSNEPEPVKKPSKPKTQKQYGGPGSFVPLGDSPRHNGLDLQQIIGHMPSREELSRDNIPLSLRPSGSLAHPDLYVPPYETSRSRHSTLDNMVNEFAELGVSDRSHRRLSFSSQRTGYAPRAASVSGYHSTLGLSTQPPNEYHQGMYYDGGTMHSYEYDYNAFGYPAGSVPFPSVPVPIAQEQYQPQYDSAQPLPSGYQAPMRRPGPMQSLPTSSSGFVPISTPAPSGFVPLPSHGSQQSGFAPVQAAASYGQSSGHVPAPSSSFSTLPHPPSAPSGFVNSAPPLPPSSSFQQQPPQPAPNYAYQPYQQQVPPPPLSSVPPPPPSAPPFSHSSQPYVPPPPPLPQQQSAHSEHYLPQTGEHYSPHAGEQYAAQTGEQYSVHTEEQYPAYTEEQYLAHTGEQYPVNSGEQYAPHTGEQYSVHSELSSSPRDPIPPPPPLNVNPTAAQPTGSRPLPQPTHSRRQSGLPIPPSGGPSAMFAPVQRGVSGSYKVVGPPSSFVSPQAGPPTVYNGPARASSGSYSIGQSGLYPQPTGSSVGSYNPGASTSLSDPNVYSSIPPPPPLPQQQGPTQTPYGGRSPNPAASPPLAPSSLYQPQSPVQAPYGGRSPLPNVPSLPPIGQYQQTGLPGASPATAIGLPSTTASAEYAT
ncbi:hypothetical protein WOLCODRAFT_151484 [Wolfiporia cocos MD-104 SS10]|uniref:C2 domain-containing protein n=1 Tax=Wolfiporia cocos (strain MD-104) TaxID=742152 RepID=A0A2H3JHU1_WOLCO|nr:hypothetical protein WOLCODRAFT_151484 [Wolfiporia cocos MD-104 SS10]